MGLSARDLKQSHDVSELLMKLHQRLLEVLALVVVAPAEHCLGVPDLDEDMLSYLL